MPHKPKNLRLSSPKVDELRRRRGLVVVPGKEQKSTPARARATPPPPLRQQLAHETHVWHMWNSVNMSGSALGEKGSSKNQSSCVYVKEAHDLDEHERKGFPRSPLNHSPTYTTHKLTKWVAGYQRYNSIRLLARYTWDETRKCSAMWCDANAMRSTCSCNFNRKQISTPHPYPTLKPPPRPDIQRLVLRMLPPGPSLVTLLDPAVPIRIPVPLLVAVLVRPRAGEVEVRCGGGGGGVGGEGVWWHLGARGRKIKSAKKGEKTPVGNARKKGGSKEGKAGMIQREGRNDRARNAKKPARAEPPQPNQASARANHAPDARSQNQNQRAHKPRAPPKKNPNKQREEKEKNSLPPSSTTPTPQPTQPTPSPPRMRLRTRTGVARVVSDHLAKSTKGVLNNKEKGKGRRSGLEGESRDGRNTREDTSGEARARASAVPTKERQRTNEPTPLPAPSTRPPSLRNNANSVNNANNAPQWVRGGKAGRKGRRRIQ
ncbi:hypothetical protein B0H16DRAFT_1476104 [Mycena metata]|uniref:Uncharacterized protein n=1 Tax=Mycena metata TaxID=1033252 RepID=A0AAD7MHB9_9AGAR|nr:hypothetical protein B0H16DRAFT_1476104 [Mycena metata]